MDAHISNLQDLSPIAVKVKLDKARTIVFTMRSLAKLEEIYGSQEEAFKAFGSGKIIDVCTFLWSGLIHEDKDLTVDQVIDMIGMGKTKQLSDLIMTALNLDMPDPNVTPSQT